MDTGRRSFLAAALAWLASLVALVWPRRGLAEAARTPRRGGFTRPTAPAEPSPVTWRNDEIRTPPNARVFKDFNQLLDDMHDHLCVTGHYVLNADNPEERKIGFSTFGPDPEDPSRESFVLWEIPLTRIRSLDRVPRSFGPTNSAEHLEMFRELLCSGEGRRKLAAAYFSASQVRFKAGLGPLPRG